MLQPPEEEPLPTPKELKRSKKRSKKLLLQHLDPGQRKQLRRKGYFDVSGSRGNVYRISASFPFNVRLAGEAKRSRVFFCMEAEDWAVPKWDIMLGQKLMIEANEGEFLKIANLQYIPRYDEGV
jgi:hypothetical protein